MENRPTTSSGSASTLVEEATTPRPVENGEQPALRLVLKKPKNSKKVNWTSETVDNEHMNKRKSKCCCVYRKPHVFGESSSESEDECDHCSGHCERRKSNKDPPQPPPSVPPVS